MTFSRRGQDDEVTFQMAPMIDIVFVLLLFFIITSTLQQQEKAIAIDLPQAQKGKQKNPRESEIVINITHDGLIVIMNEKISLEQLGEKLSQLADLYANFGIPAVILRGDRYADYGRVVEVLDKCADANMLNVSFVSVDKEP